ncbi:MAG: AMP-binding protein [Nevskia sp.]|nr:AMP-binding protein [Nevskia sp.]
MYAMRLEESYFPAIDEGEKPDYPIGEALRRAAADAGDLIAIKEVTPAGDIGRTWTYAQLYADSRRLAHALASRHRPGERVAIWAPTIPEWSLFQHAAALAGLVLVTVNPSFQARELKFVLEQSGSSALYVTQSYRGNPLAEIAAAVCGEVPAVRHLIDLLDRAALYDGADSGVPLPAVAPFDPAQIQYTSGTTGFPKGAVLHHCGLYGNGILNARRIGARRGEVWLNFMPMFHTSGSAYNSFGCLSSRGTMLMAPIFDPHAMNAVIEKEKVNIMLAVPTMLVGLLEAYAVKPRDVSSVRAVISGGAMVAPEMVKRTQAVYPASFHIIYGQTETSPLLTIVWADDTIEDICETVGQPIPHLELSIREPGSNRVVPVGEVGEICARGYMNMLRYHENPEGTAKAIDAEGWLHTGDLGTLDARGYVRITGRLKEMIIRGGENLFPVEIENALLEHPAVIETAVVGLPDDKYGEIVACFMRLQPGQRPSREELVAFCRERLSPQKTPSVWIAVQEWPLTASGKIRKFVLREMHAQGKFPDRID